MTTDARLIGGRELAAKLLKLAAQAPEITREALDDWADDVGGDARRDVPVLTGKLRGALEEQVHNTFAEVGVWQPDAYYAEWTENGNSRQEAQPFLLPAFEQHRNIRPYVRDALHRRL